MTESEFVDFGVKSIFPWKDTRRRWDTRVDRIVPIIHNGKDGAIHTFAGTPFDDFLREVKYPRSDSHRPDVRFQAFMDTVHEGWSKSSEIFYSGSIPKVRIHHVLYVSVFDFPKKVQDSKKYGYIALPAERHKQEKFFPGAIKGLVMNVISHPPLKLSVA